MTATRPSTTNPARNKFSASLSWSRDFTSTVVAALKASHHILFSQQQGIQTAEPAFCGCRSPAPLLCLESPSPPSASKLRRSDYARRGMFFPLSPFHPFLFEKVSKATGLHLLESSLHVSSPRAPADAALSRDLYVHALTHLLRALPRDLPPDQTHALASALPARPQPREAQACVEEPPPQQAPSLLRRVLASTVLFLFLLARFLLPCARDAVVAAAAYDREHGISERAVSRGAEVGRRCWEVAVGTARSPGVAWWVGEICHGAADGFGRGVELMGLGRDGGVWDRDCYCC
ncbi:MAG: hypothetical protein LQ351_001426 [Letrouitia transgressa]|nr:MAG: hypothetical protein LQ351_001426 [Letrouitia transgressa]